MARDDVKASVLDKDWDTLLSADQLRVVVYNINIFPKTNYAKSKSFMNAD